MRLKSLLFLVVLGSLIFPFKNLHGQRLVNGVLDATHTDLTNRLIKLEGTCDFYWKQFLLPASATDSLPNYPKLAAPIPKPWTKIALSDNDYLPAQGYGTYRFRIKVPNQTEVYGLKLHSIFTAYKLYVNGNLVSTMGTVGKTKEESFPRFLTQEISLPVIKKEGVSYQTLDIVLHVSNFHHRRAGAQQPIEFGKMEEIIDKTEDTLILNFFLIGIILVIGLNHLLMYALRRLDIANLIFGFLATIMIFRNLSTEERVLAHWFPNMNWELLVKLDNFSGFGTMALFAVYFYFSFRKTFPKIIFYILTGIGTVITLLVFTTHAWFYGQFKMVFEAYIGLGGLYLVCGVLLPAAIKKQNGALITFFGMFLLYTTAVNDVLHSMGVVNTAYIAPYGIAAFMVLQSYLHTKKSAVALMDNLKLSKELKQEKLLLEERIEERTQALSQQADELKNYKDEQEQQNWINEGLNQITDIMRQNKDNLSMLADQLLAILIKRTGALMGAMYFHTKFEHDEKLKLLAHYGLTKDALIEILDTKEGLTGQCFSLGKTSYLDEMPEKYFSISSGLGASVPKILALLPMKLDELTIGVIEIASFKTLTDTHKQFLTRAIENIASQLNIVKMNTESQQLIVDSQKNDREASVKNTEMVKNIEELKAAHEEAERKEKQIAQLLDETQHKDAEMEIRLKELEALQTQTLKQLTAAKKDVEKLKKKKAL